MKESELKVGDVVLVKTFDNRPEHWCEAGRMNYLMGQEVTILYIDNFDPKFKVRDLKDPSDFWWMNFSDFSFSTKSTQEPELNVIL